MKSTHFEISCGREIWKKNCLGTCNWPWDSMLRGSHLSQSSQDFQLCSCENTQSFQAPGSVVDLGAVCMPGQLWSCWLWKPWRPQHQGSPHGCAALEPRTLEDVASLAVYQVKLSEHQAGFSVKTCQWFTGSFMKQIPCHKIFRFNWMSIFW